MSLICERSSGRRRATTGMSVSPSRSCVTARPLMADDVDFMPYDGANPHEKHFHLSVVADPLCDDPQDWKLPVLGETSDGGGDVTTTDFVTWGTGVNVRAEPRLDAPVVTVLPGPTQVTVQCQTRGDTVSTAGHVNDAWSFVPLLGGYVSNIFIDHPAAWLPGVGEC